MRVAIILQQKPLVKTGMISLLLDRLSLTLLSIFTINDFLRHAIAALGYFILASLGFFFTGSTVEQIGIKKLSIS